MANKKKPKKKLPEPVQCPRDFLDSIAPAAAKFNTDHFILGSRYHTVLSLKSYPPMTDELALLRRIGDMGGVSLRLTARQVTPAEEDAILHAAANKSRMGAQQRQRPQTERDRRSEAARRGRPCGVAAAGAGATHPLRSVFGHCRGQPRKAARGARGHLGAAHALEDRDGQSAPAAEGRICFCQSRGR